MNENQRILNIVYGTQDSSLSYIKRFSMCDCLTLYMPDTYTAMGAGLELFNNKFVPGEKYILPYANTLSREETKKLRPVAFKIPKKTNTFIWSPFHDATSTYWDLGDNVRHAYRYRGQVLNKLGVAKRLPKPNIHALRNHILQMDKRIDEMWEDVTKILVFYDYSRLPAGPAKQRMSLFRKVSQEILDWPLIKVALTDEDAMGQADKTEKKRWNGWEHYAPKTRQVFYNEVSQIERECS